VCITLTEAGAALRARAVHVPWCVFEASGLSPEALTRLQGELDTLRDRLDHPR
jgi:hypothetical protein